MACAEKKIVPHTNTTLKFQVRSMLLSDFKLQLISGVLAECRALLAFNRAFCSFVKGLIINTLKSLGHSLKVRDIL